MLKQTTKELLQNSKNLLAFSAGVDSTALLFLLLENEIPFDIAIVDYSLREQSKEEVSYAKELAKRYGFAYFVKNAPDIKSNFEATAREVRYDFFEELISSRNYENLLTAHHLGDKLEWMLMQFCKGAGCVELCGMSEIELREEYKLIRPLLHLDKTELLAYLDKNNIKYFIDASNSDEKYSRNIFRKKYAQPLLAEYRSGIEKSFEYLETDKAALIQEEKILKKNALACFRKGSSRSNIYHIDKYLKSLGHMISKEQRQLLREQKSLVVGRKYIVAEAGEYICIAPYIKKEKLAKEFKEKMRLLKVDPKLRGYLSEDVEAVEFLSLLLA
ncbi:tRNA lysidine(34) synthetase TilS [Sulfurimonas paralvinellae]|uniref:tRNA(Ile)-lysidine synthase n=1 Tax=Sulfurimonas paralvinellae TaxID=317658 RepID=A0A7M1B600_9BACT|nr:tRNA lysidine(34) synthetase TilS [Sulfurimonas paralvinellae]QOP45131.1 tRNA lysidine(34) synthetase TilS [Sulfurimonas paralvinellae]